MTAVRNLSLDRGRNHTSLRTIGNIYGKIRHFSLQTIWSYFPNQQNRILRWIGADSPLEKGVWQTWNAGSARTALFCRLKSRALITTYVKDCKILQ